MEEITYILVLEKHTDFLPYSHAHNTSDTRCVGFLHQANCLQLVRTRLRTQSHKTAHHFRCQPQAVGAQVTYSLSLSWLQIRGSHNALFDSTIF